MPGDTGVSDEAIPGAPKLPVGTVYKGDLPALPGPHPAPSSVPTNQTTEATKKKREERKLAIMMMSKKRKRLFDQIMKTRNKKRREVGELKRKREQYDEDSKTQQLKKLRVS